MSVLGRYVATHGRPFALRRKNGKGVVEVRFADGYVTIYSRQPGSRGYEQEIHITKELWWNLLWYQMREIKETTKLREGPSFDRYQAERRVYREEAQHLADMREQKRQLHGTRRRRR